MLSRVGVPKVSPTIQFAHLSIRLTLAVASVALLWMPPCQHHCYNRSRSRGMLGVEGKENATVFLTEWPREEVEDGEGLYPIVHSSDRN